MYILKTSTLTKDTKFYINEYGIFYEGQIIEQYASSGGNKYYVQDVIINKFIVHFKKGESIKLYFSMSNLVNKQKFTLPVNLLGTYYKIKK